MKYSYSTDEENYTGEFDSAKEAAQEAFGNEADIWSVWVGENVYYTAHDFVNAEEIIERVQERAGEDCCEWANAWLDGVISDKAKLAELEKLVSDWIQAQESPKFWTVCNERKISRSEIEHK